MPSGRARECTHGRLSLPKLVITNQKSTGKWPPWITALMIPMILWTKMTDKQWYILIYFLDRIRCQSLVQQLSSWSGCQPPAPLSFTHYWLTTHLSYPPGFVSANYQPNLYAQAVSNNPIFNTVLYQDMNSIQKVQFPACKVVCKPQ